MIDSIFIQLDGPSACIINHSLYGKKIAARWLYLYADIILYLKINCYYFYIHRYLGYAISSYATNRIRKQDSTNVFAAVYNSGLIGAEYILDFVEKHYKEMEK